VRWRDILTICRSIEERLHVFMSRHRPSFIAIPSRDGVSGAVLENRGGVHPPGVAQSVTYIPELESIRGIAMLLVLFFHLNAIVLWTRLPRGGYDVSIALSMIYGGDSGVSLFFVLSAFLLSMPFLAEAAGGEPVDLRRYAMRRGLRVLPLYYFAVTVGILWTSRSLDAVVSRLPFYVFPCGFPPWTPHMKPFSDVWWSLHTEFQFYLMLPLLAVALRTKGARRLATAAFALFSVVYVLYELRFFRPAGVQADMVLASSLFGRAPLFFWGIASSAMYLHHGAAIRRRFQSLAWLRSGGSDLILIAILFSIAALNQWRVELGLEWFRVPPKHAFHVLEGLLWSLLILTPLVLPLRLKTLVHNRIFEHVGVLSFSVYIVHMPVFFGTMWWLRFHKFEDMAGWNPKTAAVAAFMLVAVYGISRLTYRYIERPFLRRKESIAGSRRGAEPSRIPAGSPRVHVLL
jgi:peptidoglycan/LPS O-acetylase OafA/YrhL